MDNLNKCVSCQHRCVVYYKHVITVRRNKKKTFFDFFIDIKEAIRESLHNYTHVFCIDDLSIIHNDTNCSNDESTTYIYQYKPFNVCNCSKQVEDCLKVTAGKFSYKRLKREFGISKHTECGEYKNKGAMRNKVIHYDRSENIDYGVSDDLILK